MPRSIRDASLETRTARSRLKVAHKPYFRLIEPGLHVGFRKLAAGPGTWLARRYLGDGKYSVENLRTPDGALVVADDYDDADGVRVMSFAHAQRAAKGPRAVRAAGGLTVAQVIADYIAFLEGDGRAAASVREARYKAEALILPKLGSVKIAALTPERLRRWRDEIAAAPPRLRTRKGEQQQYRESPDDEDGRRARRATAHRCWTVLRAALNHAFRDGKLESDHAWRKVKPLRNVDAARVEYLAVAEAQRLINAAEPNFRPLVVAALQSGARYGELIRLTVGDFNPDSGTLHVRRSKSGKDRHVVLTDEGVAFFHAQTAGRAGDALMFAHADGSAWGAAHQVRPMREACARAGIAPAVGFHILRHTWASHAVMRGAPLMVVAKNLGHTDTRMVEKHYSHLAPSFIADEIRRAAPRFGVEPTNIESLPTRGARR